MATSSREELEALPRRELQALAKQHGIRANARSAHIVEQLLAVLAQLAPSPDDAGQLESPSVTSPERCAEAKAGAEAPVSEPVSDARDESCAVARSRQAAPQAHSLPPAGCSAAEQPFAARNTSGKPTELPEEAVDEALTSLPTQSEDLPLHDQEQPLPCDDDSTNGQRESTVAASRLPDISNEAGSGATATNEDSLAQHTKTDMADDPSAPQLLAEGATSAAVTPTKAPAVANEPRSPDVLTGAGTKQGQQLCRTASKQAETSARLAVPKSAVKLKATTKRRVSTPRRTGPASIKKRRTSRAGHQANKENVGSHTVTKQSAPAKDCPGSAIRSKFDKAHERLFSNQRSILTQYDRAKTPSSKRKDLGDSVAGDVSTAKKRLHSGQADPRSMKKKPPTFFINGKPKPSVAERTTAATEHAKRAAVSKNGPVPFVCGKNSARETASQPKFDLKESLKRAVTWKMKKGKVPALEPELAP